MLAHGYGKTREHEFIDLIKLWCDDAKIGDDCAVLPGQLLLSADTLTEGTHFLLQLISLSDLGWKSVAVNLSDIAAMAGRPRWLLINLTLPPDFNQRQFRQLYLSMLDCARAYRTRIVGGDITGGRSLSLTITAAGELNERGHLTRAGARPGDVVVVTGDFGASAAGLWALSQDVSGFPYCKLRHCRPRPRLCESWAILRCTGNRGALMDASDGLADALIQISRQSRAGMEVDLERVPVHDETAKAAHLAGIDVLDWALYGGEDYELVGCLPAAAWELLRNSPDNPFVAIGRVNDKDEISLSLSGRKLPGLDLSKSFQHLK